jgi:ABC-type transporter Mla subunit MlaD
MPNQTTDEKLVEAVATLGDRVHALTHNVIKLDATLNAISGKLDSLIEKLEKRS